ERPAVLRRPSGERERRALRTARPPDQVHPATYRAKPRDEPRGEPEVVRPIRSPRWTVLEEQPPLRPSCGSGQRQAGRTRELGAAHPALWATSVTSMPRGGHTT